MRSSVLVTGANGFIGRAACEVLSQRGYRVKRAVRSIPSDTGAQADTVVIGDIAETPQWIPALRGVESVLHLAGRAHSMPNSDPDSPKAFNRTNVIGTEALARAALAAGVRRLVFVSSIKVNGESTKEQPFRETDPPRPEDDYGRSKCEAESRLRAISAQSGLEVVIVRPPLVYGPGVKGNLARLLSVLDREIPLPLGAVDNCRSLVGVANLVDALHLCIEHPSAAGHTFLLGDGTELSTPALIRLLAGALDRRARLLSVPVPLLRLAARATHSAALQRLIDSLRIDTTLVRTSLGWVPPYSVEQEIDAMVKAYRGQAVSRRYHRL